MDSDTRNNEHIINTFTHQVSNTFFRLILFNFHSVLLEPPSFSGGQETNRELNYLFEG